MNSPLSPSFIASRRQRPLLVPQAGSLGAIGVIRSLGLAGYPVHACASSSKALGLKSRYAHRAFVHPPNTILNTLNGCGPMSMPKAFRASFPLKAFTWLSG